ncbi:MAG: hypothetical protein C4617_05110 [Candidatus Liberibacter europaeus]|uniref:Toprim domain-containing protein n=1 Tax=Candidatus Liberibacter europaeus TaxID=744859 RepID=A0A2T4VWK3_9HYPH|nr:hypothetical protein [Candidatus Liberibacter europaeus]PTL86147.1 MAG: hypothetical protein C4617_05110 [Candidatus Liberibacter europaeus]
MNILDFSDAILEEEKLEFTREDAERLLFDNLFHVVRYLLPNGTSRNGKYRTADINGGKGKSLNVNLEGDNRGLWHDFATDDKGDIFDLWAVCKGLNARLDFPKVLESIQEFFCKDFKPTHTTNIHRKEWIYTDVLGNPLVKITRKDVDGKKTFLPFDYLNNTHTVPQTKRPLFNQVELAKVHKVILVEGEKCAEALTQIGITATTAMQGANADPAKTDWTPLRDKHICIWADNDEIGLKYGQRLKHFLTELDLLKSITVLNIPNDKPQKWDAYDAVNSGMNILEFIRDCPKEKIFHKSVVNLVQFGDLISDQTHKPEDIISSGLLVQGGLMVLAGAPKIGKSHLLLSMLVHLSAGIPFLGLKPDHPLKVCYLQSENSHFTMRDRSQQISKNLTPEQIELTSRNMVVTPSRLEVTFNENIINSISQEVNKLQNNETELIVVDPLYDVFDAGDNKRGENDNDAMRFFLKNRLQTLRKNINPQAGMILVHHTRKMRKQDVEENPFESLSGASGLRRYYNSAMLLFKPDKDINEIEVFFESRDGEEIPTKNIYRDVNTGQWKETPHGEIRLANHNYGKVLDAERDRKRDMILDIITNEASKGKVYSTTQFSKVFDNKAGLGSYNTIREKINVLMTKGHIKIFKNAKDYGIKTHHNSNGFMCIKDMELLVDGELKRILPTHYEHSQTGAMLPVENPNCWVDYD